MKPTKNRIFCHDCSRVKMLFDSKEKAEAFIVHNEQQIKKESGYSPKRSYYCMVCNGWHVTSSDTYNEADPGKAEKVLSAYYQSLESTTSPIEKAELLLNRALKNIKTKDWDNAVRTLNEVKIIIDALSSNIFAGNRGELILRRYNKYCKKMYNIDQTAIINMIKNALKNLEEGYEEDCVSLLSQAKLQIEYIKNPSQKSLISSTFKYVETKLNLTRGIEAVESMDYPHNKALFEKIEEYLYNIDWIYWSKNYHDGILLLQEANRLFQLTMQQKGSKNEKKRIKASIEYWVHKLEEAVRETTNQSFILIK